MDKYSILFYLVPLIFIMTTMTTALKIRDVRVPELVYLDSNHSIILDCDYDLTADTLGLVMKWFLNDKLIYQWIYENKPQEVGMFKGKLDLTYRASNDSYTMYRAMKIKKLSLDLSGVYKCVVSTYSDEDARSKKLVVVNNPTKVNIQQLNPDSDSVTIMCSAYGIYPEPIMNISYDGSNMFDDIENESVQNDDGLFNVTQLVTLRTDGIESNSEFVCELTIPDTTYTLEKEYVYTPGSMNTETEMIVDGTRSLLPRAEDNAASTSVLPWLMFVSLVTLITFG